MKVQHNRGSASSPLWFSLSYDHQSAILDYGSLLESACALWELLESDGGNTVANSVFHSTMSRVIESRKDTNLYEDGLTAVDIFFSRVSLLHGSLPSLCDVVEEEHMDSAAEHKDRKIRAQALSFVSSVFEVCSPVSFHLSLSLSLSLSPSHSLSTV